MFQFDIFSNTYIHCKNYASTNCNVYIPWVSLTSSQGRPRWSDQKVLKLMSSASWELILPIFLTCALWISENTVDHIKVFMNPVIFFSSPNVLVFLDLCHWCHSWVNNYWFPEFPWRVEMSTSMFIMETLDVQKAIWF